ncbi:hypothetical protein ACFP3I_06470 [Chryseobacterium arachidis]|uniref:hypothetical protein n=1 Tax=Chryseobacterium arachidis TaxID=1416778 RepID=UPI003610BB80
MWNTFQKCTFLLEKLTDLQNKKCFIYKIRYYYKAITWFNDGVSNTNFLSLKLKLIMGS